MGLAAFVVAAGLARADDAAYEQPPISYSTTQPSDAVTALQKRMDAGMVDIDGGDGALAALLKALDIPASSQMLVFSKTSLQRNHISPGNPRAIYFNDDVYVGYVPSTGLVEVAATDPRIGPTFYSADLKRDRPKLVRQTDNCLQCHASSNTREIPGLLIRSVFPDGTGQPIAPAGQFLTTHESPIAERWGGWYVTGGLPASSTGMANLRYDDKNPSKPEAFPALDVEHDIDLSGYLLKTSDPVALLVLGHQVEAHNRITRALYGTLLALGDERVMKQGTGDKSAGHSESTMRRVKSACEPLVEYLLFSNEAKLPPGGMRVESAFAKEFEARGPRDAKGRSLRELDLNTRLLKYPCSWLIYSEAFDALPDVAREYVYRRMYEVLTGVDQSEAFANLNVGERRGILEVLRETKKGLPGYWGE